MKAISKMEFLMEKENIFSIKPKIYMKEIFEKEWLKGKVKS